MLFLKNSISIYEIFSDSWHLKIREMAQKAKLTLRWKKKGGYIKGVSSHRLTTTAKRTRKLHFTKGKEKAK